MRLVDIIKNLPHEVFLLLHNQQNGGQLRLKRHLLFISLNDTMDANPVFQCLVLESSTQYFGVSALEIHGFYSVT